MVEILKRAVPFLALGIAALILLVIVRETVRAIKRWRWRKKLDRCRSLIGRLDQLKAEEIESLVLELKKSFPLSLIETVLDELVMRDASSVMRKGDKTDSKDTIRSTQHAQRITSIYDKLGFVENHIKTLQEGRSWVDRASAAEKLGRVGHARAVLPLVKVLQDAAETREVKNSAMRALGVIHDERAVEPLIDALGLPDPATGQPIADVLVKFGGMVADPLIKVLSSSKREMQRFWAARVLGRLEDRSAIPTLLGTLGDHSAKVRAEAAKSLGYMKVHEGVGPLSKMLLEDPVPLVRDASAEALGNVADDRALSSLKEALADLDYDTRRRAMEALEKMGDRAIPLFIEALQEGGKEAAAQAAAALERMGAVTSWVGELGAEKWKDAFEFLRQVSKTGVVETLARSIKHPKVLVRIRLCQVLSEAASPRTFDALTSLIKEDSEWAVRLEALIALLKLADARSVPTINRALDEEEETVRERLLIALQSAPRAILEPIIPSASTLLEDANVKIRVEAVRVLARVESDDLFPKLLNSLKDASSDVRREAALALGRYPRKEGVESLIAKLADLDREVRVAAVRSLGRLKDPEAIGSLAKAFEQADEGYRDDIASALAHMPVKDFYRLTDQLMVLSHPKSRAGIAWTLGLIGDEKAVGLLTTFLKDPEPAVRASAAGALGNFRKKEIATILMEYLSDPNERVRAAVVNALGKSGDPSVIDNLLPMLTHEPDEFVCQRVVLAVGCLSPLPSGERERVRGGGIISAIKNWLQSSSDPNSKAAGFIALALLQDNPSFQSIFKAVQQETTRTVMQGFLKKLPKEMQDRFFGFLSLDPTLFWRDKTEMGTKHYVHLLESSREVRERLHAIEALTALEEKAALPAIEYAFSKDPNPQARAAALSSLGKLTTGERLVARIIEAVRDPSDAVRAQVLPMLTSLSPKELERSREQIIPLLDSSEKGIREVAVGLLARLYHHDWQGLADQLLGTEKKFRIIGLIETLGKINDPRVAPLFIQFMKHSDPEIKMASLHAASESGSLAKNEWIPCLEDPQESVRLAAIRGLGKQLDAEIMDIFAKHLEDPSAKFRAEIARILGKKRLIGEKRPMQILQRLVRDENPEVRIMSLISLYRLDETDQAIQLAKNLGNLDKKDLEEVLGCLEKEGVFMELLTTLKQGQNINARKRAIEYLAAIDLSRFAGEIVHSLKDPASTVRMAAVEVLEKIEDTAIQQAIEALAQDPVEEIRQAVKRRRLRILK